MGERRRCDGLGFCEHEIVGTAKSGHDAAKAGMDGATQE
jgi:hypothetical protein